MIIDENYDRLYFTLADLKKIEQSVFSSDRIQKQIRVMEQYNFNVTTTYSIFDDDNKIDRVINTLKITPNKLGTNEEFMGVSVTSAPNYRKAECCTTCSHIIFEGHDNQRCGIHTRTYKVYDPFISEPLHPFDDEICDDYSRKENNP